MACKSDVLYNFGTVSGGSIDLIAGFSLAPSYEEWWDIGGVASQLTVHLHQLLGLQPGGPPYSARNSGRSVWPCRVLNIADLDACVHGAARPGAKAQRCFNLEDKVTAQEGKRPSMMAWPRPQHWVQYDVMSIDTQLLMQCMSGTVPCSWRFHVDAELASCHGVHVACRRELLD